MLSVLVFVAYFSSILRLDIANFLPSYSVIILIALNMVFSVLMLASKITYMVSVAVSVFRLVWLLNPVLMVMSCWVGVRSFLGSMCYFVALQLLVICILAWLRTKMHAEAGS